jgi:hypothetical protein
MKHAVIIIVGLVAVIGAFFVGCAVGRNGATSDVPAPLEHYSQWSAPMQVGNRSLQYRTNLDSGELEQREISSQ